ncbi:MAG: radical SAM protein [Desulfobacteraceae bacterium]|nr:radical SAM protein [Desulfobacteraceae bacterium]
MAGLNSTYKYLRYALMAMGGKMKKKQALTGPWKVIIGVTDFCNYNCIMCREHSDYAPEQFRDNGVDHLKEQSVFNEIKKMDFDLYCRLIDDLKAMGVININLSGKGEPLMHRQIKAMIGYAINKGLQTELTTNASLLDSQTAEYLVTQGVKSLHCSLNAGSPETYSRITGTRNLDLFLRVKENIRELARIKKSLNKKSPIIMLSFVITSQNYHEVEPASQLAIEAGAERISFVPVSIYYNETTFLKLKPEETKRLLQKLAGIQTRLDRNGLDHNIEDLIKAFTDNQHVEKSPVLYEYLPCYAGWYFALILANGTVMPCCQCLKNMGNLKNQSFKEIWNSPVYQTFRSEAVNLPDRNTTLDGCLCRECSFDTYNLLFHNVLHPLTKIKFNGESINSLDLFKTYFFK